MKLLVFKARSNQIDIKLQEYLFDLEKNSLRIKDNRSSKER